MPDSNVEAPLPLPGTHGRRRIYLLRHGAVNYFKRSGERVDNTDVSLTGEGRRQATAMTEVLAGVHFDRALHSGLARTRETAEIVLGGAEVALAAAPAFREIEVGHIDRVPPERIDAEFTYGFEGAATRDARFAGGERYSDFYARVCEGLRELLEAPDWTRLLLVAHGGTNRAILAWATLGGLAALASFEQDECCLNVLDVDLGAGEILRRYIRVANFTPYNLAKDGMYLTTLERVTRHLAARPQP